MEYLAHVGIMAAIYCILSLSLNLVVGYCGRYSLSHAAFYGTGAYATAILTANYHTGFFASMLFGAAIAAAGALVIGLVLNRLQGEYYLLASLGFVIIMSSVFNNLNNITGGALGIAGIPPPAILDNILRSHLSVFLLAFLICVLVYALLAYITSAPFGRILRAGREDEEVVATLGYNTTLFKTVALAVSGGVAAIAGSILAAYVTYVSPSSFDINESILILVMVILGGLADLKGSLLGATILVTLPESLRFLGLPAVMADNLRQIIYGAALILMMFFRPQGFLGKYKI
ncbi:MAG: Inner-membrane translocator [Candidatus Magasanikbacteria bacterium GW2011_GWA2_56_11]|uniref:Inner-membrane translocator n=1 Tax=Candidatus Magasanikbacteria bacterium GW2011_GWA2_56_11 TaxID=1619044 RepID=A0A0G2BB07_9BACT|nr:MAG: Inner-membrane translocator [Candidatus Magasanikbacteria bacterium GW2011_GWA2_56_11]